MKTHDFLRQLAPVAFLGISLAAQAQNGKLVDRRDQAEGWYLPLHGIVLADGQKADGVKVVLYKNNELVGELPVDKKGHFLAELDIDNAFALVITKDGYQMELLHVDTTLPEGRVEYPEYECTINMEKATAYTGKDEGFYLDFPAAIVRWSDDMKGFYHSETYHDDIKGRLAGYAQASF